jgi:hypothetical protein
LKRNGTVKNTAHRYERQDAAGMPAILANPHADVEAFDQVYLQLIAAELAPFARAGYACAGRGAVILGTYGIELTSLNGEGVPARYLSQRWAQETGVGWPAPEIVREIEQYNPQREFIVCINRAPHPNFYRLHLHP